MVESTASHQSHMPTQHRTPQKINSKSAVCVCSYTYRCWYRCWAHGLLKPTNRQDVSHRHRQRPRPARSNGVKARETTAPLEKSKRYTLWRMVTDGSRQRKCVQCTLYSRAARILARTYDASCRNESFVGGLYLYPVCLTDIRGGDRERNEGERVAQRHSPAKCRICDRHHLVTCPRVVPSKIPTQSIEVRELHKHPQVKIK